MWTAPRNGSCSCRKRKIIFDISAVPNLHLGHNSVQVVQPVELFRPVIRVIMPRFYLCLRLIAVAVASPVIAICILIAAGIRYIAPQRRKARRTREVLRLWMSVGDWVKGIPVGYSYWVQYQAPVMLDEIVVHHDE